MRRGLLLLIAALVAGTIPGARVNAASTANATCDFGLAGNNASASPGGWTYIQLVIHCPTGTSPVPAPVSQIALTGHKFTWPPIVSPGPCPCGTIGPSTEGPCPCVWSFQATQAVLT